DLIAGLNWIVSPENPGPQSHAVVTLSTYRVATDLHAAGPDNTVEQAIRTLLARNLTVIASANNQNGNACHTTPARMSINNPDLSVRNNVITAGGSMIINQPWTVDWDVGTVADGPKRDGTFYGPQPAYDPTKAVRDGRWICGPGDSSIVCSNLTPTESPNPASINAYEQFQGGSNAGPCVTLFAPAKNMFLASPAAANAYRDARTRGGHASGTSWSAPVVAGFAARLLQVHPGWTPVEVRSALLANSAETLDVATLNTVDHLGGPITGTPNKLLQLGDVNITDHPDSVAASGQVTLSVSASGTSALSYQWYEVNAGFDLATYNYGAHSSTAIAGATSSTFVAPASQSTRAYWVRVTNAGGSADSNIAVVTREPACEIVTIMQQPQNQTIVPGQTATVTVVPGGTGPWDFQWYEGPTGTYGSPVCANTASCTVGPLTSTKQYWVRVRGSCDATNLFSDAATVTVQCTSAPVITAQPTSRTISQGQTTTLSVSASQAVSYQWYQGTAPSTATPVGTNSSSLTVTPSVTTNYWVRVSNACGSADSTTATVTVAPVPPAQITRIQSSFALANSQTSITAHWTQPTQAGTFLVAVISAVVDPNGYINFTAPAGWSHAVTSEWTNVKLAIYYRPNNPGARTSETFTVSPGYHDMTLYVLEYSGIVATNPLDKVAIAGNGTNDGYVETGFTQTTAQAKELVITGLTTYTQTEFAAYPANSYTEIYDKYM
ncbi:MAG TPA: S8 family serine peptidase, partial [Thermoanaerobaculia bacterium]|nr:S8 family serine peptidase [Thermoanaerobaculia bacterium]